MEKIRIYELAKELNTTSKRLIEKLSEVDINVKNHMSYLEKKEVEVLYKHIGVLSKEEKEEAAAEKKDFTPRTRPEAKKPAAPAPKPRYDKDRKRSSYNRSGGKSQYRDRPDNRRFTGIKVAASSSGLRSGFVRDTGGVKWPVKTKPEPVKTTRPPVTEKKEVKPAPVEKITEKKEPPVKEAAPKRVNAPAPRVEKERSVTPPVAKTEDVKKKEFTPREHTKEVKRDQKRETPRSKPATDTKKKFKPRNIILETNKEVSKIIKGESPVIDEILDGGAPSRKRKYPSKPRKGQRRAQTPEVRPEPVKAQLTLIKVGETITVKELAERLKKTAADVIKKLISLGVMATVNQEVDFDVATLVADEYGVRVEKEVYINEEDLLFDDDKDDEADLSPRPPVAVVMGHVDHGKTSLLDAIRKTNVTDREEGGITQHIGAYMVKINDRPITFLDTPGHEAFTQMRARGAKVTDIAILVVAADDGVMPQTIEAINHAKAAEVQIIVAINKIDKPGANTERIKQQLTEHGLLAEEWGGDTIMVPVSAKNNENIEMLLEMVLLSADMMELKSNPKKQAKGTVIESQLDKNRGPIATLLVQRGTLKVGDSIITGTNVGRIRAMYDDKGQTIKTAGPSTPVEILGMPDVSSSGDIFYAIEDERIARALAEKRRQQEREDQLKSSSMVSLEELYTQIKEGNVKDLNIILKADVQGSVEALKQSVEKLTNDEVRINVIHGGVGAITETDVKLAEVSNAIIIGFNVRPTGNAGEIAQAGGVDIKLYRVIYDALNDIEAAMKGMLDPTYKEVVQGHVEIRQIYRASGVGNIAGSYVLDGKITRNAPARIIRDGVVVYEGKLESLKRFKDDVREVTQGYECGILFERFNDIKEGDIVESYIMEEV